MTADKWENARLQRLMLNGQKVTVKVSDDGDHALIAMGWDIRDIRSEDGTDHVHVWDLRSGDFRLHDMRFSPRMLPNVRDEERARPLRGRDAKHEDIIRRATELRGRPADKMSITEAKQLQHEWQAAGRATPANHHAFKGLIDQVFESNRRRIEQRKAEWAANRSSKERLVSRAESLASSSDLRLAGEQMRALADEWKRIGPCEKSDNDRLWDRFNSARSKLRDRKEQDFAKRKSEWAANRSSKERLVSRAESLASSSDLRLAGEQMRALADEWKRIGPCEKSDNDRLWDRFNSARSKLRDRKEQDFAKRKAEWAANRSSKERLVAAIQSLSSSVDFRSAKDQARALNDQWRATGPCEKEDNERLWARFKAAKDALYEAAARDSERRRDEWKRQAWERVSRLEDQLRNVEAAIIRAEESYSRALSARSPSTRNPNWASIVRSQQERQSRAQDKISSLRQRRGEIIDRLSAARAKANSA